MFVLPFSSVHLSPVSFLRRNAKLGGFFGVFLQQRLSHVHEQVQGLLQVPGPLASTPHHPIDRACKFDSHAFCTQLHHPLRSIYNVATSRNIYIPPPHTIQSVTQTMFASSMNVNIPPHTIHCVASTMIMSASSRIASSIDCEEA